MKKQPKFSVLMGMSVLCLFIAGIPNKYDADKTIIKTFNVDPPAIISLDNQFGDIEVSVWNEDVIEIEVEVQAFSGNKSNAEKFVRETTIDFSHEGNRVYARTKPGTRKSDNRWISWFKRSNQTFEVNYRVKIPEQTNLDLENKHGDILLEDYDGDLELELSYGTIKAGNITGIADISLKHGEAKLQSLGNGELEVYYSEFKTQKAGNLNIKSTNSDISIPMALNLTVFSKYDEYQIGQIDNFNNEGAYDEFDIEKARSINITSRFTELTAEVCELKLEADMTHGELDVRRFLASFDGAMIEGNGTDYSLKFDGQVSIDLMVEHTSVDLDPSFNDVSEMVSTNKKHVLAHKGKKSDTQIIKGDLRHGSIRIR